MTKEEEIEQVHAMGSHVVILGGRILRFYLANSGKE
jgi:hypothetical protein